MDTYDESSQALRAAQVAGWYVGIPLYDVERHRWRLYAFDATERPNHGMRKRERTVVGQSEQECVREMARLIRELSQGPRISAVTQSRAFQRR